ncbi:ribbon-helix-helix domain-containing protein [Arenibaculum sp.]|jgi:predicted DNA-binding ribbon-helix-helix protein|uniref:ribbon-helix-helix domain-containing protein n=1 Tax=Arenibaculum sp. TaxID=2865862 RepID=UPI002E0E6D28|nr:ribbon-helix-helix domain-containing protein [Arenibaculum sp.]
MPDLRGAAGRRDGRRTAPFLETSEMTDTSKHGARAAASTASPIGPQPANDEPVSRRVAVSGRPVTVRLGKEAWAALEEVCAREEMSVDELCARIERQRGEAPFAAAVRVFVASYFMRAAQEERGRPAMRRQGPVAVRETE